jgi:phage terminase small subunit
MDDQRKARLRTRRNKRGDGSGPRGASKAALERRRRFVDAFLETGNATQAAIKAGYARKSAAQQASQLLKIPQVADLIRERQVATSNTKRRIMTREDRQALWTEMAEATGEFKGKITVSERQRAAELLGKTQADFVEVRVAPVVVDTQASEDELVTGAMELLRRVQRRLDSRGTA